MERSRHLVAYDIRDPKRLRLVARVMRGHGIRMQYSVFVCDLTAAERLDLLDALYETIDPTVDCVACVDLGAINKSRFTFIGPRPAFPTGGARFL
jgi:CRISPR-associated protein Cas2